MNTFVRFLCAFLLAAGSVAFAQRSFSATLTATGTTSSYLVSNGVDGSGMNYHTLQVVVTGGPSGCTVRLEGSLDGTNWFDLSGSQTCTSNAMFHVDGKPVAYVRANLLTWTGGTNAVITYKGSN